MVGTWSIRYPKVIQLTGTQSVTVAYQPDRAGWSDPGAVLPERLAVRIWSPKLKIEPSDGIFAVNVDALRFGHMNPVGPLPQDKTWVISPPDGSKAGETYTLMITFDVSPDVLRLTDLDVNGAPVKNAQIDIQTGTSASSGRTKQPLPSAIPFAVEVKETFEARVWNVGRAIVAALAFLLALPCVTEIVKAVISRLEARWKSADETSNESASQQVSTAGMAIRRPARRSALRRRSGSR